jgi:hypothetical protein
MLINFDRRIAKHLLSCYTKVHSLIIPDDLSHLSVRTVHDCGKGNGPNMQVLSNRLNLQDDWLGHSPGKIKITKSSFLNYFGPLLIVGESKNAPSAFKRLLLQCQGWMSPWLFRGLTKLHCYRFLYFGQISKRFLQGIQPVEL